METIDMRCLPRTFRQFCEFYNFENSPKLFKVREYRKYLFANVRNHHYGWAEDLHNWFAYEMNILEGK